MRAQSTTTCSEGSCGCASCSAPRQRQVVAIPNAEPSPSGTSVRHIWWPGEIRADDPRMGPDCTWQRWHQVARGTPLRWSAHRMVGGGPWSGPVSNSSTYPKPPSLPAGEADFLNRVGRPVPVCRTSGPGRGVPPENHGAETVVEKKRTP